jgi:hypothetical protein
MSSTQMRNEQATRILSAGMVDMKLDIVVPPVSDVDRARRFYLMGWRTRRRFCRR